MIEHFNYLVLRNPSFPVDFIFRLNSMIKEGYPLENIIVDTLFKDKNTTNYIKEAIYTASPELFQEIDKWLNQPVKYKGKNDKIALTLYKYLIRMSTRCTPFGLFSGCSIANINDTTRLIINDSKNSWYKHSRLDMNYLSEMVAHIENIPEIKRQLKFYPNTSIYKIGNEYRFVDFSIINKYRKYNISRVDFSTYLAKVLKVSKEGKLLVELAEALNDSEVSIEEAYDFINELVKSKILISELEPNVTGCEYHTLLINKLERLKNTDYLVSILKKCSSLLKSQKVDINNQKNIFSIIKGLPPSNNNKHLIQTDLFFNLKESAHTVGNNVISSIKDCARLFYLFGKNNSNPALENFKKAFLQKYELQEMPFTLALDPENGLGYHNIEGGGTDYQPLIEGLNFKNESISLINLNAFELFKINKLIKATQNSEDIIHITLQDLKYFGEELNDLSAIPESFFVLGTILGKSFKDINKGIYKFDLKAIGGPSAVNLLARFCHGSRQLEKLVKNIVSTEEIGHDDLIFTEICHLPQARIGNILMRPTLREYEIPYMGQSTVCNENKIYIDDLTISIRNNKIVLKSKRLDKEILPRLTSAHNFSNSNLAIYRFLCDLQRQNCIIPFNWDWGMLSGLNYLPRVEFDKIIVSKAKWNLHRKDFPEIERKEIDYGALKRKFRGLHKISKYVTLKQGDNELMIDLEIKSGLKLLIKALKKSGQVNLTEFLGIPENCFLLNEKGEKYANEIVIPFRNIVPPIKKNIKAKPKNKKYITNVTRNYSLGSEWFYLKIYSGIKTSENILVELIKPLTENLIQENIIKKWFFIRYSDPEHHLRIRFYNPEKPSFGECIIHKIKKEISYYIENNLVTRVQTDIYKREIERYGNYSIELSEDVFYSDSVAVINLISLLHEREGELDRALLALKGVDLMLEAFNYTQEMKLDITDKLQKNFFSEFKGDKYLNRQLNERYRNCSKVIYNYLKNMQDINVLTNESNVFLQERFIRFKSLSKQLEDQIKSNTPYLDLDTLLASYIHMFLNRLFTSNQRKNELVIYHYLSKYYYSVIARADI